MPPVPQLLCSLPPKVRFLDGVVCVLLCVELNPKEATSKTRSHFDSRLRPWQLTDLGVVSFLLEPFLEPLECLPLSLSFFAPCPLKLGLCSLDGSSHVSDEGGGWNKST